MALDTKSYHIPVARTVADLRRTVKDWREKGKRIGLVPTMGSLHVGHTSLVDIAGEHADEVVVSIFVNPTQFAPHEDFDDYPRAEAKDAEMLKPTKASLIYAPKPSEMYAPDFSTSITVGKVSDGLCSVTRPHFFGGVAVVVAKLLLQCDPDFAVFGEKDYQQLLVIRRMVRDLDITVDILAGETAREEDGLAISSRNLYLSKEERKIAVELSLTLIQCATDISSGLPITDVLKQGRERLQQVGFDPIDYVELRDAETLGAISDLSRPARILAAATLGKTRLIDNFPVDPA